MKQFIFLEIFFFFSCQLFAQSSDTLLIDAKSLELKNLQLGKYSYVMFLKSNHDSPSHKLTLINMDVKKSEGNNSINIIEEWESMDTITHVASTTLNSKTFATQQMQTWWKHLKYTADFDFINKKVKFDKQLPESYTSKIIADFNNSFNEYNLNWHADIVVLSVLPYKEGRSFKINYYDPGLGASKKIVYSYIGSETILDSDSKPVDCYTLMYTSTNPKEEYQKFWISKNSREVLKEEDLYQGHYRYKIKLTNN